MRAIYCAGEQARVVLDILSATDPEHDIVLLDDDASLHGEAIDGVPIIGDFGSLEDFEEAVECLVAFGDSRGVRLDIAGSLQEHCSGFFNAVHPDCTISESTTIGEGVTVNAESYIGPGADIGDHVLIDSCTSVSHGVQLAAGVTVTPNVTLAGDVTVERDAYIGPGATIVEDVTIGAGSIVGAGAVVTESVEGQKTVVGVPAQPV